MSERERHADLIDDFDRRDDECEDGTAAELLVTFTETTYPTVAQAVYACHPVSIDVAETEGVTPTLTADTGVTIYALNIGSEIPVSGSHVIGHATGGRWTFAWDSPP